MVCVVCRAGREPFAAACEEDMSGGNEEDAVWVTRAIAALAKNEWIERELAAAASSGRQGDGVVRTTPVNAPRARERDADRVWCAWVDGVVPIGTEVASTGGGRVCASRARCDGRERADVGARNWHGLSARTHARWRPTSHA
mgnify:FL=1